MIRPALAFVPLNCIPLRLRHTFSLVHIESAHRTRATRRSGEFSFLSTSPPIVFASQNALSTFADEHGLSGEQAAKFERYFELLTEWNTRMNLTSIVEREKVFSDHFSDSLSLRRFISTMSSANKRQADAPLKLVDVGTGAGLPGIPLAIACSPPNLHVTLLEATAKKARFLETVVAELSLPNVTVLCGRAEELGQERKLRESYRIAVARCDFRTPR
mmetsp:Transcript_21858/g.36640  ORF Transcript_21858/g.36640 Transcript_21858/m.36640 type:complete len:217 (+) Transcript_21858:33-683(+)